MRRPLHEAHVAEWRRMLLGMIRDRCRPDGDCWIWALAFANGRKVKSPTPVMAMPNRGGIRAVRRVSAEASGKKLLAGLVVSPTCGNPACVNPLHLRVHTRAEAFAMAVKLGRSSNGIRASARRLEAQRSRPHVIASMELARKVRARFAELGNALVVAREFGLKHDHAHKIIRHKLWKERTPFDV